MPTYRYPVLLWKDSEGYWTARALDEDRDAAAISRSRNDATDQVRHYLTWRTTRDWDPGPPDMGDPRLVEIAVNVRPVFPAGGIDCPGTELIRVVVPCVEGRQEKGSLVCHAPTLDITFQYFETKALRPLLTQRVQNLLGDQTARQISRYLRPAEVELRDVTVRAGKPADDEESPPPPVLAHVADSLSAHTLRGRFTRPFEREGEVAELAGRLEGESASILITGERGCGKTAVLVEAISRLKGSPGRFWFTAGFRLTAGMRYIGQWQGRCEAIIEALRETGGVLCVDNLQELLRVGGRGPADSVWAFLAPYVQRGEVRIVAEATPAELQACHHLLPGIEDDFSVLPLPSFGRTRGRRVLQRLAESHGKRLEIPVEPGVPDLTYDLFARFLPYHPFPGKAARFLTRLIEKVSDDDGPEVVRKDVIDRLVRETGLPATILKDDIPLSTEEVLAFLGNHVMGQDRACQAVASMVTTFKAGLNDPERPIGVLLFCGPTGVGKTELARTVSRFLFGHGKETDRLIRLDMSEYAGPTAAHRLIGDPYGDPSDLIQRLREQPFSVILLDEIEKAAPEVFDILLGVLDEGRLTDRFGRTTVFRSSIIILTSNLGAEAWETVGFGESPGPDYENEAMAFFRPEFFNRLDGVVTFDPLGEEAIRKITEKELTDFAKREGLRRANLRLTWTDAVVDFLAREGFDPRYGARPLQRTIEEKVGRPLARYLVSHPGLSDTDIQLDEMIKVGSGSNFGSSQNGKDPHLPA